MRLKKLELYGFKSFAQKTSLEFGQGVTAVVGPNGSGKSNISDAIRWALGEQSARQLRGNKMEDVIFNGTHQRKALGMSEVSLCFDNQDGILPIDFAEVTVTRRIFRSGESDYLLNNTPCRLRDIYDLFAGTGVGRETYATIEQGKIDLLTSTRPEERRIIFEEAAGILKHKNKKREALNKLKEIAQKLIRLEDLLREISQQLIPLEESRNKAIQYNEYQGRLIVLETKLALDAWAQLKKKEEIYRQKEKDYLDQTGKLEALQTGLEKDLANLEFSLANNQLQLEDCQEKIHSLNNRSDLLQMEIKVGQEREREYLEQQSNLEKNKANLAATLEQIKQEIKQQGSLLAQLAEKLILLQQEEEQLGDKIKLEQGDLQEKESHLNFLKSEIIELLNARAKKHYEVKNLTNNKNLLAKKKNSLQEEEAALIVSQEKLNQRRKQLLEDLAEKKEQLTFLNEQSLALTQQQQEGQQSLVSKNQEIWQTERKLQNFQSRFTLLEEMERALEGYNKGVKGVLQRADSRVAGTVAQLIRVEEKYEKAIETALGQALQHIVTASEKDAQRLIEYLKETKGGRATFLPLNCIQGSRYKLPLIEGILGLGVDLISFAPQYNSVMNYLLGRIAVAENLDSALILSRKLQNKLKIVTLEGEVISPGGAMTGGSFGGKQLGLLGRIREIKQLQQSILFEQENLQCLQKEKAQQEKILEELREKIAFCQQEREKLKFVLHNLIQGQEALDQEEKKIREEREILVWESKQLEKEEKLISGQEQQELDVFASLEGQREKLEQEIVEQQQELEQGKEKLKADQEALTQLKVDLATVGQEKISQENNQKKLELRLDQLEEESFLRKGETARLAEQVDKLRKEITAKMEEYERLLTEKGQIALALGELKRDNEHLKKCYLEQENKKKDLEKQLNQLEKSWSQTAVYQARVEAELAHQKEQLQVKFSLIPTLLKMEYFLEERERLQFKEEAQKWQEKISYLGLINPGAIEEYQETKARYDFLTEQYGDLQGAKASLEKLLQEIDEIMKKRFLETFQLVQKQFKQVFQRLFNGGKAELSLADQEDILTSGIEINVQPPGKKLQNLSLLSGGEKALTAVALLFAILQVNPSPFCLLDEIDAPFDDANVVRVAELLKEMAEKIQFIIITHRKGAMEVADALYGVTMEEAGISRLISVKLEAS